MLGRMIKVFISSILQRRPSIFNEVFMLGMIFFFQFCKDDPVFLRTFFGGIIEIFNIYSFISAKKPQHI